MGPSQIEFVGWRFGRVLERIEAAVEIPLRVERWVIIRIEAGNMRGWAGQAVGLRSEAMAAAEAQQEHGQALVMVTPFADLLPLVEDRPGNAVLRAFHRRLLDCGIAAVERRIPGVAKGAATWPPAQLARGLAAHPDMLGCGADAAAVRK